MVTKTSEKRIKEILVEMTEAVPGEQAELETVRDSLIDRLDRGAVVIERKKLQGQDVIALEDKWIELLHTYEWVCDRLGEVFTRELQKRLAS